MNERPITHPEADGPLCEECNVDPAVPGGRLCKACAREQAEHERYDQDTGN